MSVRTSDVPVRFDPQFVTDEDIKDLESFTGMSGRECLQRLRCYSMNELARAWDTADPSTPSEFIEFYQATDLYVWELMQWHASPARAPYWDALHYFAENYPARHGFRRVFDFGCGIGTDALFLAQHGYEVTAVDVNGSALAFARHRFSRRKLSCHFEESTSETPKATGTFDVAVCFDVFEHLPDPLSAAQTLVDCLRPGGILLQQAAFGDGGVHPCHLRPGIARFSGLRWHIYLAGMGMRSCGPMTYVKCSGFSRLAQRARFALWRATDMWLIKAGA